MLAQGPKTNSMLQDTKLAQAAGQQLLLRDGARKKDVVETALKRLVCAGTIKLADAQKAILDWPTAYKKYVTSADKPDTSDN